MPYRKWGVMSTFYNMTDALLPVQLILISIVFCCFRLTTIVTSPYDHFHSLHSNLQHKSLSPVSKSWIHRSQLIFLGLCVPCVDHFRQGFRRELPLSVSSYWLLGKRLLWGVLVKRDWHTSEYMAPLHCLWSLPLGSSSPCSKWRRSLLVSTLPIHVLSPAYLSAQDVPVSFMETLKMLRLRSNPQKNLQEICFRTPFQHLPTPASF